MMKCRSCQVTPYRYLDPTSLQEREWKMFKVMASNEILPRQSPSEPLLLEKLSRKLAMPSFCSCSTSGHEFNEPDDGKPCESFCFSAGRLGKPEQNCLMTAWKWKFRGIDLKIRFRDRGMHLRNSTAPRERFFGCCRFVTSLLARSLTTQSAGKENKKKMKTQHRKFTATSIQLSEASWRSSRSFLRPSFSRYPDIGQSVHWPPTIKRFRNTSERFSQLRSEALGGVRGEVFFLPPGSRAFAWFWDFDKDARKTRSSRGPITPITQRPGN